MKVSFCSYTGRRQRVLPEPQVLNFRLTAPWEMKGHIVRLAGSKDEVTTLGGYLNICPAAPCCLDFSKFQEGLERT